MGVHTNLGHGLLKSPSERCLCFELGRNALPFARQVDMKLNYEGMLPNFDMVSLKDGILRRVL